MDVKIAFIIYLILYRLAIIAVGAVSITLGYRLFCKGIGSRSEEEKKPGAKTRSEAESRIKLPGMEFMLKSAAPGTFFAIFGVVIISAMIVSGAPEMTMEIIKTPLKLQDDSYDIKGASIQEIEIVKLRGEPAEYAKRLESAENYYDNGQHSKAAKDYREALKIACYPMNALAWIYFNSNEDRMDEALRLSEMAVRYNPGNPNYRDTLAEILYKKGEFKKALVEIEKADEIDEKYEEKVEKFREAVQ